MPLLRSLYKAPRWIPGKHSETILPAVFRKVGQVTYQRERVFTPDGDFLDLDWRRYGSKKLAILTHGLEGSTSSSYMLGMTKVLNEGGWDVLAWNFRSCSGEINLQRRFYHAGNIEDLDLVVHHATRAWHYNEIALIGFSMGGNVVLKYLAESSFARSISKSVVFSVPCDLQSCVLKLSKGANHMYLYNFLFTLKAKVLKKAERFPELLLDVNLAKIRSLVDFDNYFTAPLGGFKDAFHYYDQCSTSKAIENIQTPCLIVNAKNDPILDARFFPWQECKASPFVYLETPSQGGHLGFMMEGVNGSYWSEERALQFLQ